MVKCYAYGVRGVKKSESDALYWAKKVRATIEAKLVAADGFDAHYLRRDLDEVKKALDAAGIAGEW